MPTSDMIIIIKKKILIHLL